MPVTPHKLISLLLAGLMLLAPLGNVFAGLAQQGHPMPAAAHLMPAQQAGDCASCQGAADIQHQGKPCCEGASCALMGGCSACAATFFSLRVPVRVSLISVPAADSSVALLSRDPDLFLRPPRA